MPDKITTTGAERAAELLAAKAEANRALYAGLPAPNASRQVQRTRERANDYWPHAKERSCRRPSAGASTRVIHLSKAAAPRVSRPKAARYPQGMKHAWQRKAAARAEFAKLAGVPA